MKAILNAFSELTNNRVHHKLKTDGALIVARGPFFCDICFGDALGSFRRLWRRAHQSFKRTQQAARLIELRSTPLAPTYVSTLSCLRSWLVAKRQSPRIREAKLKKSQRVGQLYECDGHVIRMPALLYSFNSPDVARISTTCRKYAHTSLEFKCPCTGCVVHDQHINLHLLHIEMQCSQAF